MIDLTQFIIEEVISKDRPKPKRLKKYLHFCDKCNVERGYFIRTFDKVTKNGGLCRSCSALALPPKSEKTRKKISETRKERFTSGQLTSSWVGSKHSEEAKQKMSIAAKSRIPVVGWKHSEQAKARMSCARCGIALEEFDSFLTGENDSQRALFKAQGLHWKCFEKANYTCQICNNVRSKENPLHAHHMDGWNWAIERRFDETNLVCLCNTCHEEFHSVFGKGNNTQAQYEDFRWQKQLS